MTNGSTRKTSLKERREAALARIRAWGEGEVRSKDVSAAERRTDVKNAARSRRMEAKKKS